MAKITNLSNVVANAQAEALAKLADGGFIDIMGGSQPHSADESLSGQKVAVTLRLNAKAFRSPIDGMIVANAITFGVAENDVNPVTWARVYGADHKTALMDVSVGTRDASIILPSVNIPIGITVTCSHFAHTITKEL